jgi:hypothetical protein
MERHRFVPAMVKTTFSIKKKIIFFLIVLMFDAGCLYRNRIKKAEDRRQRR